MTVAYKGVTLVVTVKGGRAWIKVWVDGKIDPGVGAAGQVISNGKTLTFTGRDSIEVRTGSSGVTYFTLNGTSLGTLGKSGVPETWLVRATPPTRKDAAPLAVADDPLAAGEAADPIADPSELTDLARQVGERCSERRLRSPRSNRAPAASSATSSPRSPVRAPTSWAAS